MAERVFGAALAAGALSVDALEGQRQAVRPAPQRGRAASPARSASPPSSRELLDGSEIVDSHDRCGRVQDPYSFRCQPQVMGAALDLLTNAARTLTIEASAVTDNPLAVRRRGTPSRGGNFHAQPVAFAADIIAMALCEVGSLSERRTAVLVDPKMSGLPAFLTEDGGVNSGLMIPQVTAAALVSENKQPRLPGQRRQRSRPRRARRTMSRWPPSPRARRRSIARNAAGVVARRADRRRARRRLPRAAEDQREAAGRPRQGPRASARASNPTATGRTKWPRSRRRCWPAALAWSSASNALFFAQRCQDLRRSRRPIGRGIGVAGDHRSKFDAGARPGGNAHLLGGRLDRVVLRLGRHRIDHQIVPAVARGVDIDLGCRHSRGHGRAILPRHPFQQRDLLARRRAIQRNDMLRCVLADGR